MSRSQFIRAAALLGVFCTAVLAQPPASKALETPPAAAAPASAPQPDLHRFGLREPIAKPAGTIRIATYNLENLFDDYDDPTLTDRNEDRDATKPAEHCAAAAAAIRRINPDILALEEVESRKALVQFRDTYLADMGYVYLESMDAGDARGIEQSVLSRFPIIDARNWPELPLGGEQPARTGSRANPDAGKPITFHRSPLRVTVEVPPSEQPEGSAAPAETPYHLTLFVVHQKSGSDFEFWREKEAAKTVELVGEMQTENPDANIIIVGDFNATPGSKSATIYTTAGLIDAFGDTVSPKGKSNPKVITHESGRVIDRILLNPAAAKEFNAASRFVLSLPARPEGVDWRTTPPPDGYASDHYPVVIDLTPVDK
ncbi:MAG: endonuclease/exonuclease/phosphatase family protein [Phycisphaeraceae bacterium]|nr:endonuclease/exonuclease/phosphatase family protein [Phycisphaeraceae bacterium]